MLGRVLAIDLDGVLFDFWGGVRTYLRRAHGVMDPPRAHRLDVLCGKHLDDVLEKMEKPAWHDEFIHLFPDSIDALVRLRPIGDFVFVGGRVRGLLGYTRRRLHAELGPVLFSSSDKLHLSTEKVRTARVFHATHAFEDDFKTAQQYERQRIVTYLIGEQPPGKFIPRGYYLRPYPTLREAADACVKALGEPVPARGNEEAMQPGGAIR